MFNCISEKEAEQSKESGGEEKHRQRSRETKDGEPWTRVFWGSLDHLHMTTEGGTALPLLGGTLRKVRTFVLPVEKKCVPSMPLHVY